MENLKDVNKTYQAKILHKTFTAPDKTVVSYYDIVLNVNGEDIHCKVSQNDRKLLTYLLGE